MVKILTAILVLLIFITSVAKAEQSGAEETPPFSSALREKLRATDIFLEVSLSPQQILAEGEALLQIKLYMSPHVQEGWLHRPTLNGVDTTVRNLQEKTREIIFDEQAIRLVEYRTLLYPHQSGNLTVGPAIFEGIVLDSSALSLDPFTPTRKTIEIQSQQIEIEVLPTPCAGMPPPCLVARNVTIEERLSSAPAQLEAGTAVTYDLTLRAEGVPARFLPSMGVRFPKNGAAIYADQPFLEDREEVAGLTGIRQERGAILPSGAGSIRFAPLIINWWNTQKDQFETIRLPERILEVAPPAKTLESPGLGSKGRTTTGIEDANKRYPPTPYSNASSTLQFWLAILAATSLTAGLIFISKTKKRAVLCSSLALYADRLQAVNTLRQGCRNNCPQQVKTALLAWAGTFPKEKPPKNLDAVARGWTDLDTAIATLNEALYSGQKISWNGRGFWTTFKKASKRKPPAKYR